MPPLEGPDGTRVVPGPPSRYARKRRAAGRKCMVNLKAFKAAREQIDEIARVHIKGAVRRSRGQEFGRRRGSAPSTRAGRCSTRYEAAAGARAVRADWTAASRKRCEGCSRCRAGRRLAGAGARRKALQDGAVPLALRYYARALCQTEAHRALYASLKRTTVDIAGQEPLCSLFNGYQTS